MRILIAAGIYPPDVGGPATHAKQLKQGFIGKDISVRVISYGKGKEKGLVRISRKLPFGIRHFCYLIMCFIAAARSDIVYAQDATAAGLPAFIATFFWRRRFCIRIGGDIIWERALEKGERFLSLRQYYDKNLARADHPFMFFVVRFLLKRAEAVIVSTPLLKDLYSRFYGVPAERLHVVESPVFSGTSTETKKAVSLSKEPIILFAGRFVAYKNLEFLIKAFDEARQKSGSGILVFIGDGPELENLKNLIGNLPSRNYIKILPPQSHEEIIGQIKVSKVCVSAALTEFNPNFILECLALKKPVLVSREHGITVKLPEEFLFDPTNLRELTGRLLDMLTPAGYKKASELALGIRARRSWDDVIQDHLKILWKS